MGWALLVCYSVHSSLPVDKMNDIIASKINLSTILLKYSLPKRSSSHKSLAVRFSSLLEPPAYSKETEPRYNWVVTKLLPKEDKKS